MSAVSARRLIVAYAALVALLNLSIWLPGNPHFSSAWGFVGSVAIQALIVWRLWHGSSLAWFFAMAFATLTLVMLVLMQPPLEVGVILVFVLSIAQAAILWTRPINPLASTIAGASDPLGR